MKMRVIGFVLSASLVGGSCLADSTKNDHGASSAASRGEAPKSAANQKDLKNENKYINEENFKSEVLKGKPGKISVIFFTNEYVAFDPKRYRDVYLKDATEAVVKQYNLDVNWRDEKKRQWVDKLVEKVSKSEVGKDLNFGILDGRPLEPNEHPVQEIYGVPYLRPYTPPSHSVTALLFKDGKPIGRVEMGSLNESSLLKEVSKVR